MKYEHTPRPQIEDHYHIRELIEAQEKRSEDRQRHKDKDKRHQQNIKDILDAKDVVVTDFYCEQCEEDFKSLAIKNIEQDWNKKENYLAFYKAKCSKGHWCVRLVTDKWKDGFFIKSKNLVRDRRSHAKDIIQPSDTGYSLLYGKKNA